MDAASRLSRHALLTAFLCGLSVTWPNEGLAQSADHRLPDPVGDFFERALDEGLLPASGDEAGLLAELESKTAFICPKEGALDFLLVREFRQHSQLVRFMTGLRGRNGNPEQPLANSSLDRLKAYIALGFYVEALAQIEASAEPGERALAAIARYLEARGEHGGDVLEGLRSCSVYGEFWAEVAAWDATSHADPARFNVLVMGFRDLPVAIRTDVLDLLAPILWEEQQDVLMRTLLATFKEEDFAASARLRFVRATLEMHANAPGGVTNLRRQMAHPQFRDNAISLLAKHQAPVSTAEVALLRAEIPAQISAARTEAARLALLDFWIQQARLNEDTALFDTLLMSGVMSDPVAQEKLRLGVSDYLTGLLSEGVSNKTLRVLAGLSIDSPMAAVAREDRNLMTLAASLASEIGRPTLAYRLADLGGLSDSEEVLLKARIHKANWAFLTGNHRQVLALTSSDVSSAELDDLAVRSAIKLNDSGVLSALLERTSPTPEQALVWLEEETLQGVELLPATVLDAARQVDDPDIHRRLDQLMVLRSNQGESGEGSEAAPTLADLLVSLELTGANPEYGGS